MRAGKWYGFFVFVCALCLFLSFPAVAKASQESFPKVFEVSGPAEVFEPSSRHWAPLEKKMILKKDSKIRTGDKGSIHIVFDDQLNTAVRLARNSQVSFPKPSASFSISLEKGRLFVIREEKASGFFEIHSRHIEIKMGLGGLILDASKEGILVRVYGGPVFFKPASGSGSGRTESIGDGFKFFRGGWRRVKGLDRMARMVYQDYIDWQPWARQWYEMKDDFNAERLEKEMDW